MTTPYLSPPVFSWPAAPGGKLHTYLAGGTTPQVTYSDAAGVTPNANPVTLDTLGSAVVRLAVGVAYHVVLKDALDVGTIWDADNIDNAYLTSGTITAAIIGAVLYPQTAAEIAGGVTPTLYNYPAGDVRRYNAKLDGVTDDHLAWQAADSQSANGGVAIYLPRTSGGLATPVGLTVSYLSNVIFEPEAFVLFTGNSNLTALTIGSSSVAQVAFSRRYERLYVTRQTQSDWTNEAAIGIKLLNMAGCWIDIAQANNFTIGVQCLPQNNAGFQDCDVRLGQIYNNKIGMDLSNATGGFCNENNFYGARLTQFTIGTPTNLTCYGVRVTSSDGVYVQNNNNRFWGFGIDQLSQTRINGAIGIPFLVVNGINNHVYDARDEANSSAQNFFTGSLLATATSGTLAVAWPGPTGVYTIIFSDAEQRAATLTNGATTCTWPTGLTGGVTSAFTVTTIPFAWEQNASSENTYEIGYASYVGPPRVMSSSTSQAGYVRSGRARQMDFARLLFDSGPIHQRACWYDGATAVHIPRCSIADSGSATVFTGLAIGASPFVTDAAGRPKYLEVSVGIRGPAIFVRCDVIKQFIVTRDCDNTSLPITSYGGEIDINCYDATGSLITTAGSIVGTLPQAITSTANFGGAFHTGSDSNNDAFFTVANSSVAYLRICIARSTNNLRIRSFRIWGVNAQADAATWPGYEDVVPGANIGTAAPSSAVNGTWGVGRTVFQAVPVVGSPKGWRCTVSGTPGTWVSEGVL